LAITADWDDNYRIRGNAVLNAHPSEYGQNSNPATQLADKTVI